MAEKTLNQKLCCIQQEMKAPKNLRNSFGNYNYRNAEGILEAFKPFEKKYNVALCLTDCIEEHAGNIYICSVATLIDCDSDRTLTVSAMAREAESKKGMDASQVTGATSSYARKYALNGLFLLDDTKDADSDEYKKQDDAMAQKKAEQDAKERAGTAKKIAEVSQALSDKGIKQETVFGLYKIESLKELDAKKCDNIMKHLDEIKAKEN